MALAPDSLTVNPIILLHISCGRVGNTVGIGVVHVVVSRGRLRCSFCGLDLGLGDQLRRKRFMTVILGEDRNKALNGGFRVEYYMRCKLREKGSP